MDCRITKTGTCRTIRRQAMACRRYPTDVCRLRAPTSYPILFPKLRLVRSTIPLWTISSPMWTKRRVKAKVAVLFIIIIIINIGQNPTHWGQFTPVLGSHKGQWTKCSPPRKPCALGITTRGRRFSTANSQARHPLLPPPWTPRNLPPSCLRLLYI